jgi:hypothetical protein
MKKMIKFGVSSYIVRGVLVLLLRSELCESSGLMMILMKVVFWLAHYPRLGKLSFCGRCVPF